MHFEIDNDEPHIETSGCMSKVAFISDKVRVVSLSLTGTAACAINIH